jgi:Na+/H+ antiporter NhaD/arsenite permease-like protein
MNILLVSVFVIGYAAIALEHNIKLNKAASALITGVLCWVVYAGIVNDKHLINEQLTEHLGEVSGILFFLLSAMTIVELIDSHDGFSIITTRITQKNKRSLLWIISFVTFFLSALLDNLTTTIVIISLLRKLVRNGNDRLYFSSMVIIAANAGGAWSPIGDITTTMLWIGGQITAFKIIARLILPSLACLLIPLLLISIRFKGSFDLHQEINSNAVSDLPEKHKRLVLFSGIAVLIAVPVFKTYTGLPPYMGILLGLGVIWIITEFLHSSKKEEEKHRLTVVNALKKIDTTTILFFLGILMAVSALQSGGILRSAAGLMDRAIGNQSLVVIIIGLLSSIVDNVPLVAAAQGMYDLSHFPTDHFFWEFLAYSAGTGGSALVIGSAAGIAAMGMEKINFFWYLKKISIYALAGFFSGALVYLAQNLLVH